MAYPLIVGLNDGLNDPFENYSMFQDVDDGFGLPIFPHQIARQQIHPLHQLIKHQHHFNPFTMLPRGCPRHSKITKSKAMCESDDFQVCVDVKQFQPKEISVKTIDNTVVVEAKHEERDDEHGSIYRHFIRRYTLPKKIDPKDVVSSLSSDGVLTVKAPLPQKQLESSERVVQIQQTGPAHLNVKVNGEEKAEANLADKVTLEDAPEEMD